MDLTTAASGFGSCRGGRRIRAHAGPAPVFRPQSEASQLVTGKVRRCAVLHRKSSEEGLDQTFKLLDAQREACEAYIRSQATSWKLVEDGLRRWRLLRRTLERPALRPAAG